jgi:hypothetical protein
VWLDCGSAGFPGTGATMVTCPPLAWGQPNGFQTIGFVAFSAGFVLGDTPTVSTPWKVGVKSSGKFPKTVGVCKDRCGLIHEYSQAC